MDMRIGNYHKIINSNISNRRWISEVREDAKHPKNVKYIACKIIRIQHAKNSCRLILQAHRRKIINNHHRNIKTINKASHRQISEVRAGVPAKKSAQHIALKTIKTRRVKNLYRLAPQARCFLPHSYI